MRIAIASSGLGHIQRGIEAWAKSLAEGLCREGQDVVVGGKRLSGCRLLDCQVEGAETERL